MTLRWARSPVAPNSTRIDGSGTRSSRNPSRRTFVAGFAREARLPSRAMRRSLMVSGASLGRGAGRAGIGWSGGASTGAGSLTLTLGVALAFVVRRVVATIRPLLGLDFVAAELVAERGEHLGAVRIVLARPEAGQQRERDDRRRDVVVDRLLDSPAALPGIGDEPLDVLEVGAVRLERTGGQLEQPRADDRALHPQVRDAGEVELVVARVQDLEALCIGLHQAVFDAVVDHLHVVAGARTADVEVAAGRGERGEDRDERLDRVGVATDHQAVADLEAPDPTRCAGIDVLDAVCLQVFLPPDVVVDVRVATVDDRVARLEVLEQLGDLRLGRIAGRDHDPDRPRLCQPGDQFSDGERRLGALAGDL